MKDLVDNNSQGAKKLFSLRSELLPNSNRREISKSLFTAITKTTDSLRQENQMPDQKTHYLGNYPSFPLPN